MYQYINQAEQHGLARQQKRVLFTVIVVLFILAVVFGILYFTSVRSAVDIRDHLQQRILNCVSKAIDTVPAESSVNSLTASKVGNLKGFLRAIEEMNQIALSLYGEGGRIVDQTMLDALNKDLDDFDKLLQQSTVSTITVRTTLNGHLNTLRDQLRK